jgi:hypothetical protein
MLRHPETVSAADVATRPEVVPLLPALPQAGAAGVRSAPRRRGAALLALALLTTTVGAGVAAPALAAPAAPVSSAAPDLGRGTIVFDPTMPTAQIQARVDAIFAQQVENQFGTERYALLFKPGTYGSAAQPLDVKVGYYTEVAGLGRNPADVTINGGVTAFGRAGSGSLDTFWRSVSNLTIDVVPTADDCHTGNEMWAVSQAAPMRRVDVKGFTTFMPYCEEPNYASGGFVADSRLRGGALNGSQQQFYVRNTDLGSGWSNGVWNQVFSGDVNAPAQSFGQPGAQPYTTLANTPVSKEKPYLYLDAEGVWNVFEPAARRDSVGTSWQAGPTAGTSIPLSAFYVARPGDSLSKINSALAQGRHLLLTPGVYDVDTTIAVKRADTVVLGLGLATLTAQKGVTALSVADVDGVDIAGLTVDAGPVNSPVLMQVGSGRRKGGPHRADPADPTALQDVFFRVGGPHVGKADISLEVNSDQVLLDDLWVWRADHGKGVGWTVNTAATGVVVNGDDVTATGLFVEHFQKYNTIWRGERGRTVFYQNELPYDAPDQAAWRHDGVLGWAAYKVADTVRTHEAWGLGSYIYTSVNPTLHASNAFEVPVTPGVRMHDLVTVSLNRAGTIDHVINGVGAPALPEASGVPSYVVSYPTP